MGYSWDVGLMYPVPVAVREAGDANRDRFHLRTRCGNDFPSLLGGYWDSKNLLGHYYTE